MSEVATAFVSLIPSAKGFGAGVGRVVNGDMQTAGKKAGGVFGGGLMVGAKSFLGPMAAMFAATAGASFFSDSISQASDLAESGNKITAVFGDATAEIEAYADKGAKALGQNKLAVLDAASTFGVFGKAAGLTGGPLAQFSTDLTGLSTDLASFYNTSPQEAVEAIGAAMRGESEPIRKFGVLLDDASMRSQALKMGLISTTKQALTPQQKVLAAQALIMAQTSDAQGDFARTSGGLANQQRILSAQWTDLKGVLGSAFLPAVTGVVGFLNSSVVPVLAKVAGAVGPVIKVIGDATRGFFDFLKTGKTGSLAKMFDLPKDSPLLGMLTSARDAIAPLVGYARRLFRTITETKAGGGGPLASLIGLGKAVLPILRQLGDFIMTSLIPTIGRIAGVIQTNFVPAFQLIASFIMGKVIPALTQFAGFFAAQIMPRLTSLAALVMNTLVPVFASFAAFITTRIVPGMVSLGGAILGAAQKAQPFIAYVVRIVSLMGGLAVKIIGKVVPAILKFAGPVFGLLFKVLGTAIGWIGRILGWVGTMGNKFLDAGAKIGQFASAVSDKLGDVVRWFKELPGRIVKGIGNLGKKLYGKGRDLVQGLLDGAGSILPKIGQFFLDKLPAWIRGPFKQALGIASPSKVFAGYGRNVGQGLIEGLNTQVEPVRSAVGDLTDAATPRMRAAQIAGQLGTATLADGIAASARVFAPTIVNNYPAPERASESLAMSLRRAQYAMGA